MSSEHGLDPILLRRLLRKTVAALAPPRLSAHESIGDDAHIAATKSARSSASFQKAIRKMITVILKTWREHWDDEQIEPLLLRIKELAKAFPSDGAFVSQMRAPCTWLELQQLVTLPDVEDHVECSAFTTSKPLLITRRASAITRAKLQDRSRITETYEAGLRIRNFSTIVHRPSEPKWLVCSGCTLRVSSCWYFRHPKTSALALLVPNNGHAACRKLKRLSHFQVEDGSAFKTDNPNNVDYCEHNRLRHVCGPCGGLSTCEHGKPRWNCTVCRSSITRRAHLRKSMGSGNSSIAQKDA
eukprot:TRINITY_DN25076_c0_g1_i1.p1 TRINITY_DN25076_c0_g1~~TRINITY_DN25076_c0_g1_i1.p1  ORF type:complete len:332 (+),score=35.08 TRINITY_DN25076_c0_g1_i1:100-996(+)